MHSLDTYYVTVYGPWGFGGGHYLSSLQPNEEKEVVFRVNALGSADVYLTITGQKGNAQFWWESAWTRILLNEEKAELERVLVLSHPYTVIGKTISAEATIWGLQKSTGLTLEFWNETPSGKIEELTKIDIKELSAGAEVKHSTEFQPKETGTYTIEAYLYDGWRRIGHKTNYLYVQKQ